MIGLISKIKKTLISYLEKIHILGKSYTTRLCIDFEWCWTTQDSGRHYTCSKRPQDWGETQLWYRSTNFVRWFTIFEWCFSKVINDQMATPMMYSKIPPVLETFQENMTRKPVAPLSPSFFFHQPPVVDLPLWKLMEWKSVGMMKFPTFYGTSFKKNTYMLTMYFHIWTIYLWLTNINHGSSHHPYLLRWFSAPCPSLGDVPTCRSPEVASGLAMAKIRGSEIRWFFLMEIESWWNLVIIWWFNGDSMVQQWVNNGE